MSHSVFVFGSNLAGIHGAGAARHAMNAHGAKWRKGIGRSGSSYAIPTKDHDIRTLDLHVIQAHVEAFLQYVGQHLDESFMVTRIGCGLAGYADKDIAPMFMYAPSNCIMPAEWKSYMRHPHQHKYFVFP